MNKKDQDHNRGDLGMRKFHFWFDLDESIQKLVLGLVDHFKLDIESSISRVSLNNGTELAVFMKADRSRPIAIAITGGDGEQSK